MGINHIIYRAGQPGNEDRVKIQTLKLHKDKRGYYLSAKFEVEDKHSIREIDIPRIGLNINADGVSIRTEHDPDSHRNNAWVNLGFGFLPIEYVKKDGQPVMFIEKVLEEKYTEMTMNEIEKKLGYKVKIVSGETNPG